MRHPPTVFEQIIQRFPWERIARERSADEDERGFNSRKHFLTLLAARPGGHQGLRPVVAALAPNSGALRLLGGKAPARSTPADANRNRPAGWFVDLLLMLIGCVSNRANRRELKTAVRLIAPPTSTSPITTSPGGPGWMRPDAPSSRA